MPQNLLIFSRFLLIMYKVQRKLQINQKLLHKRQSKKCSRLIATTHLLTTKGIHPLLRTGVVKLRKAIPVDLTHKKFIVFVNILDKLIIDLLRRFRRKDKPLRIQNTTACLVESFYCSNDFRIVLPWLAQIIRN